MLGLHWAIVPIGISNIGMMGYDIVMPCMVATTFAQTGAVIAIMLKTKDKRLKGVCVSAAISGFFGVTEPAIYGITLPKKKPFHRIHGSHDFSFCCSICNIQRKIIQADIFQASGLNLKINL